MNTSPLLYENTFRPDDGNSWLPLLKEMMKGAHPGLLATIDEHGQPQVRWMSTLSLDFYPYLYALTSSACHKVREIQEHPAVTWMFFNQDLSFITTLRGKARVLTDLPTVRSVYRQISGRLKEAFVDSYLVGPEMVVLETKIESVECVSPANSFKYLVKPGDLEAGRKRLETFEDKSNFETPVQTH
ncbi:hypothetical protein BH09VER1_BH09VER1_15050 [soil metagenome]